MSLFHTLKKITILYAIWLFSLAQFGTIKKVKNMKKYAIIYKCKEKIVIDVIRKKKLKEVVKSINYDLLPCEVKIYKYKKGISTQIKDSKIVKILTKIHKN